MIVANLCKKCGGSCYNDNEDEAYVCIVCGKRHYYGKVGTKDDVEGRRKRIGLNHKYEGSYYNGGHSPRGMFA